MKKRQILVSVVAMAVVLTLTACGGESFGPISPIEDIEIPEIEEPDFDIDIKDDEEEEPVQSENSAYSEIFTEHYIVHASQIFFGLDAASYAIDTEDYIEVYEFGYDGDVIQEWIITVYYSSEEYPMENIKSGFVRYEELSFCEVEYEEGNNYNTVRVHMKELDQEENYSALYEMQLTTENGTLSIQKTGEGLEQQGYIKK